MKDPNERRALLAIGLCIAVFYGWSLFFAPPPTEVTATSAPTTPPAVAVTLPAVAPAAGSDPSGVPAVGVADAGCTPGRQTLATGLASLEVDACGRGIASLSFPTWNTAARVTPWWTWVWNAVSGKGAGGWTPYVLPSGNLKLLSDKGSFAIAGQGVVAPGGAWTLSSVGKGVQAQRTTAEGLVVTEVFQPTDSPDVLDLTVTFASDRTVTGPLWVAIADSFADLSGNFGTTPWVVAKAVLLVVARQCPPGVSPRVSVLVTPTSRRRSSSCAVAARRRAGGNTHVTQPEEGAVR